MDSWNTGTTEKESVDFNFVFKEEGIDRYMFKFNSDIITRININSL